MCIIWRRVVQHPHHPSHRQSFFSLRENQELTCSVCQLGQIAKTRQKVNQKIREIDWSYLCLKQFDRFWNIKRMQLPETEIMWRCWHSFGKIREIASSELIIGRFLPFVTSVWHVWAWCGFNLLLMAGNWLFAIVSAWQFACQRFDFTDTFWQLAANSSAQP
jgi:hypothetical protein